MDTVSHNIYKDFMSLIIYIRIFVFIYIGEGCLYEDISEKQNYLNIYEIINIFINLSISIYGNICPYIRAYIETTIYVCIEVYIDIYTIITLDIRI